MYSLVNSITHLWWRVISYLELLQKKNYFCQVKIIKFQSVLLHRFSKLIHDMQTLAEGAMIGYTPRGMQVAQETLVFLPFCCLSFWSTNSCFLIFWNFTETILFRRKWFQEISSWIQRWELIFYLQLLVKGYALPTTALLVTNMNIWIIWMPVSVLWICMNCFTKISNELS